MVVLSSDELGKCTTCYTGVLLRDVMGKLFIRSFPFLSLTKKSLGIRMGKGKGKLDRSVKLDFQVLFYLSYKIFLFLQLFFLKGSSSKLSVRTKIRILKDFYLMNLLKNTFLRVDDNSGARLLKY
jgi:ribosomal protein L16/L10AE